jgi:hypothetical protein
MLIYADAHLPIADADMQMLVVGWAKKGVLECRSGLVASAF